MNAAALLLPHKCLVLSRSALHQLRISLEKATGVQSATYLQEAGFASGEGVYNAFVEWVAATYFVEKPADLDIQYLGEAMSGFFQECGWGTLVPDQIATAVMCLDSHDWSEASPESQAQYPSCHFSCGMLADFMGRLSGGLMGVMEVECRSRGEERCRFLAGSPETLGAIYDRMNQGITYQQALGI